MDVLVNMIFGSKLYGLDHQNSDSDYMGIFIPDSRDIILSTGSDIKTKETNKNKKNNKDDIDITWLSLKKFIHMACRGDLRAVDMLHAPQDKILETSEEWKYIQENRQSFYSTNCTAFRGFFKTKVVQYSRASILKCVINTLKNIDERAEINESLKGNYQDPKLFNAGYISTLKTLGMCKDILPTFGNLVQFRTMIDGSVCYDILGTLFPLYHTIRDLKAYLHTTYNKINNQTDVNYKELSHVLRVGYQLLDIFNNGDIIYPLKQTDSIMACKLGHRSLLDVEEELNQLYSDVMIARGNASKNGMLSEVNIDFWDDFVYDVYCRKVYNDNLIFEVK